MSDCTHERLYVKAADETFRARIGCLDCDKWMQSVEVKGGRLYTRAEVLAFGARVAAEYERQLSMTNTAVDVDVARLLEET